MKFTVREDEYLITWNNGKNGLRLCKEDAFDSWSHITDGSEEEMDRIAEHFLRGYVIHNWLPTPPVWDGGED